jgi:hypothetical protein
MINDLNSDGQAEVGEVNGEHPHSRFRQAEPSSAESPFECPAVMTDLAEEQKVAKTYLDAQQRFTKSHDLSVLQSFLDALRWKADDHIVNHEGEHVWLRSVPGGITDCCPYEAPCPEHDRRDPKQQEITEAARVLEAHAERHYSMWTIRGSDLERLRAALGKDD